MARSLPLFIAAAFALAPNVGVAAEGTFESNGVTIRYVSEGEGDAVVLIHGWMADASTWGRDRDGNPKPKAIAGLRLIALDCRGHGKSGKPHDPEKYGPEMAADVVRLLDHLKIDKAHLVGYSSGAFVAGKVAATHPRRVLSVVYAGQAPVIDPPKAGDFSECDLFAKTVDEGKDLGLYVLAIIPAGSPKPSEEQAKALAGFLYGGKDVKAFAAAGRGFKNLAVTGEELARCAAPTLFIHGGNESDHVKGRVAAVRKLLDKSQLKVVEGANHVTTLAKPEFGDAVLEFLRSHAAK